MLEKILKTFGRGRLLPSLLLSGTLLTSGPSLARSRPQEDVCAEVKGGVPIGKTDYCVDKFAMIYFKDGTVVGEDEEDVYRRLKAHHGFDESLRAARRIPYQAKREMKILSRWRGGEITIDEACRQMRRRAERSLARVKKARSNTEALLSSRILKPEAEERMKLELEEQISYGRRLVGLSYQMLSEWAGLCPARDGLMPIGKTGYCVGASEGIYIGSSGMNVKSREQLGRLRRHRDYERAVNSTKAFRRELMRWAEILTDSEIGEELGYVQRNSVSAAVPGYTQPPSPTENEKAGKPSSSSKNRDNDTLGKILLGVGIAGVVLGIFMPAGCGGVGEPGEVREYCEEKGEEEKNIRKVFIFSGLALGGLGVYFLLD